jgi:uncharacterized protein
MNRIAMRVAAGALLAVGLLALPAAASKAIPSQEGSLAVFDEAKFFTPAGIDQAKSVLSSVKFSHGLNVTVDTYPEPPADRKDKANAAKGDKEKWHTFIHDWAVEHARGDKAKGIYILVCANPGGVAVIADRETRERGFTKQNEQKVWDLLVKSFQDANTEPDAAKKQAVRDAGLKAAMQFIVEDLKSSTVPDTHSNAAPEHQQRQGGGMGSIGGWICIGLVVLLGVWLVIGLFRAMTGSGGGGMGGGGGGGGFMSSLFGGLFGAMAGMWLYNSFFGHSGGFLGGSDAYAGDNYSGGGGGGDTGAGDWSGDDGAAGGFDNGGGGDADGWGGGGDWGGGGGDFGGGGGDF